MDEIEAQKAIRKAVKSGDLQQVKALVSEDESRLHMQTPFGSWLHVAASAGQLDIVEWLIAKGIDVDVHGGTAGGTPLDLAASDGQLEVVRCLIERGASLDVSEPERNPLFGAIYGGHTAVAKLLIDSGIDTSVKYSGENMTNMDALAFAKEWGRSDIVEMLAKHTSER